MITSPKLAHYRNASLLTFLSTVVTICNKFDVEALKINTEVAKIATDVESLEALFSLAKKNDNTESLENLDARRDAATLSIQGIVECYARHFDKSYEDAAKAILKTFARHGKGITRQVYRDQTATTRSLINDFESDAIVSTALNKLHLTEWVQELKLANEAFDAVYVARNMELSVQPDQNFKDKKTMAIEDYRRLIDVLKAFNIINPNGDYDKILKALNELVLKYNV